MWYLDATFKIVKEPFYQLFSIYAFVKSSDAVKRVPLVFALMSRRRRRDYKKVFECVTDNLGASVKLKEALCDFEAGIWKGLREVYPSATLKGCVFHWTQAVYRKLKSIGLEPVYHADDATHKFIWKLLALPFLHHSDIRDVFQVLEADATTPQLVELMTYVRRTWLGSSVWTVKDWSIFGRAVRTNNDVERWHHRLNDRAGRSGIQFYLLLTLLHREADLVNLQVRLVSEGKLKRVQRKTARDRQAKIFQLWGSFEEFEIGMVQLLKQISSVYGPVRE